MNWPDIQKPTLLLDEQRAWRNIQRMAEKAHAQGIRLRPHFKTHQSAEIGEWFRQQGVNAITVSSVDMAQYFARHGWDDITIAFPANLRQMEGINDLARAIRLGVLVDSVATAAALRERLSAPVDVWIEIDEGTGRTGIPWGRVEESLQVAAALRTGAPLRLQGLLTHTGRAYRAASEGEIRQMYAETVERMNHIRQRLNQHGYAPLEVSVGDTPSCTLAADLGSVDEIRPGNFVFYDAQQLALGVCQADDVAVAVACPVVGVYPDRQEAALYGGAVHLTKDTVGMDGRPAYGLIAFPADNGWGAPIPGAYVARLTQEHGVVHIPEPTIRQVKVGDLLCVLPAHVCLVVSALREYKTLAGKSIKAL
jgi:D-serine deaminase-like pyridoxal phosphate-dependent protein